MKSSLIHHCTLTGLAFVTAAGSIGAQTLGFGLSVSPSTYSVLVSNSITYTIDVTNRTGLTVSDLWVTNSFSTPVTVESISFTVGNGVNYTGSAFTKSSEILLDFKQFTPTGFTTGIGQAIFTVIPNPASFRSNGFFTNAVVAIAPALQTVPNSAFTNVVIQVTNALFVADLGVVLTGFAQGILAGDILNYRATVTNHGRDKVSGV